MDLRYLNTALCALAPATEWLARREVLRQGDGQHPAVKRRSVRTWHHEIAQA